ncbi:MAG TPA: gamma-glutamyl-gamma-aminobutyrate hydrolase family protein [Candidatus Binatia bacterium]|nr:gamma-glutamyl-gamma-aminobutyrate hydrolase family protein [Candidatus Binatia bacterium]
MPRAVILQHVACEGPGRIATALAKRRIEQHLVRIDRGDAVPRTIEGWDALVVMGGPMGVYEADRYPHLKDEIRLIQDAIAAHCPTLGICLGSQLVAAALGAPVAPGPRKEIGWHPVEVYGEVDDLLLREAPRRMLPLHWHGDQFDLRSIGGATTLARSAITRAQAFHCCQNAWGLLFHLEADVAQVQAMTETFAEELRSCGIAPDAILADARRNVAALEPVADAVFGAFADEVIRRPAHE